MAFIPTTSFFTRNSPALSSSTFTPSSTFAISSIHPSTTSHATNISMSANRKFFVGGNWKCNGTSSSISELINALNAGAPSPNVQVTCAPPFPYLISTKSVLRSDFELAAQNCWIKGGGAFTGEVSTDMLKDVGCTWVILGHSERRNSVEIHESDIEVAQKTKFAIDQGLKVILCIGELLEQREAGETLAVCQRQLQPVVDLLSTDDWENVVIAYEPVWAIGTGKVATPQQAQETHQQIRTWLAEHASQQIADQTRILYGGSVNGANCDELATLPDVDGFLVGGASLKPEFLKIIDSHKSKVVV